jgi:hypothetical protein
MRTLDKDARQRITRAVLLHAFKDDFTKFIVEETALIQAIIDRLYPGHIQDMMADLIEFSDPFPFDRFDRLTVNYAGPLMQVGKVAYFHDPKSTTINLEQFLPYHCKATGEERRISIPVLANNHSSLSAILTLAQGEALGERIDAYWRERERLTNELNSQRGTIMGVLAHIRNERQLKEKWPEIVSIAEPFLKQTAQVVQLPAVITSDLNAKLKLPAEVKEAA